MGVRRPVIPSFALEYEVAAMNWVRSAKTAAESEPGNQPKLTRPAKAYARSFTVFADELYAGRLERIQQRPLVCFAHRTALLERTDADRAESRGLREIRLSPIQEAPCRTAKLWGKVAYFRFTQVT
jgi:hypothetical protein